MAAVGHFDEVGVWSLGFGIWGLGFGFLVLGFTGDATRERVTVLCYCTNEIRTWS